MLKKLLNKLVKKEEKPEKKKSKKYILAAVFFAMTVPVIMLSKIRSRKKKL